MRTIIIGLSNELPLTAPETLEIADSLVRRVAAIKVPSAWMQGSQSGQLIMVDVIHYMESQPLGSDFESVILFLMWIPIKFVKYTCTCEASEKQCKNVLKILKHFGLNVHHIIIHITKKN